MLVTEFLAFLHAAHRSQRITAGVYSLQRYVHIYRLLVLANLSKQTFVHVTYFKNLSEFDHTKI
jgi:hypothetical protein